MKIVYPVLYSVTTSFPATLPSARRIALVSFSLFSMLIQFGFFKKSFSCEKRTHFLSTTG
jgi:hypothetical protein